MDDKLALLHPSLGLAFTAKFSPLVPRFHTCKDADRLTPECDGCREEIGGKIICCQPDFELGFGAFPLGEDAK